MQIRFGLAGCVAGAILGFALPSDAALITFSGLDNNPQGNPIPSTYQPLLNTYTGTSSHGNPGNPGGTYTDGANIGVGITWDTSSSTSNHAVNGGVYDHTNDSSGTVLFDNGNYTMTIVFSKPVLIPSFYYANYSGGQFSIQFQGYATPTSPTPAVDTGLFPYSQTSGPNNGGYQWIQETALAGTPIEKLVINGGTYKQIDDMTVNAATPEPASLALLCLGGFGLLARRNRV